MEKSKKLNAPVINIVFNYQLLKINLKTNVEIKCQKCDANIKINSTNNGYDTIILDMVKIYIKVTMLMKM